jgi:hypothetical protein
MDKLKEKLNNMRTEAEAAHDRADQAEAELREYESLLTAKGMVYSQSIGSIYIKHQMYKDAEILGLKNRTILLEGDLQRQNGRIEQVGHQKGFSPNKSKNQPE